MSKNIAIYGSGWQAARTALTLADLGIRVEVITPSPVLESVRLNGDGGFKYWTLALRAALHPHVSIKTSSVITGISGEAGEYTIAYCRSPRYVKEELCTACGECIRVCSVKTNTLTAIHKPDPEGKSAPSAYMIDKDGVSPCRTGCPLEINVHGFVALVRQGKYKEAGRLINSAAPMAGVLGRLCTHPCELKCARNEIDKPLFIQALHRYVADQNCGEISYSLKSEIKQTDKIAIIGSGPAGLTAAWELARRGYKPTIFESKKMAGGMLTSIIPGFRLPSEVCQKEIEAILKMDVEIKTGLSLGRDFTLESLKKEGYKAFFLAIGAHNNNRLNIPGENLEGVVDCLNWLRNYNTHSGGRTNERVVVIGGGNSAVDSARSARRLSQKEVSILCLTEEMTAVREEVEEAEKEGIPINYNCSALEILGENGKVAGIRVIRVRNVVFEANGNIKMEQIAGSEFILPADRVVVAIGQRPDSSLLKIKGLDIATNSTIKVAALTLETNLPGIFAGGDAVTGSKDVVSAMAAGLRAAESIQRYLQGVSLKAGRSLEPPKPVTVDLNKRKAARYHRSKMPALALSKRKEGSHETSLGLTPEMAEKESSRCLDCAGCCECLECEKACEVKAVNHQDEPAQEKITSAAIISFLNLEEKFLVPANNKKAGDKSRLIKIDRKIDTASLEAIAFKVSLESGLKPAERTQDVEEQPAPLVPQVKTGVAVFLCSCGGSTSAVLDFPALEASIIKLEGVKAVHKILQSCTREGAEEIKRITEAVGAGMTVLAACRCCSWEQVCFSCSESRIKCRENLTYALPANKPVEYVNMREMAAWLYRDNPLAATRVAAEVISAGVKKVAKIGYSSFEKTGIEARIFIISHNLAGWSAAVRLAQQGYAVTLISGLEAKKVKGLSTDFQAVANNLLKEITGSNVDMLPWPDGLTVNGAPGQYEIEIRFNATAKKVNCGGIILDLNGFTQPDTKWLKESNLLSRVLKRLQVNQGAEANCDFDLYPYTIGETWGIAILNPSLADSCEEQIAAGEAAAARVSAYLLHQSIKPRGSAVTINRTLCRGCGDCSQICSLIELKPGTAGVSYAEVSPALCLGCGACVAICPTGAIKQPAQSEEGIEDALAAILDESRLL